MTTTNYETGIDGVGRNTSRVLAPPGGKSSNIFGTDDAGAGPHEASQAASKRNDSTVFSGPQDAEVRRVHRADDNSQNTIFGNSAADQDAPKRSKAPADSNIFGGQQSYAAAAASNAGDKSSGGYNPITGQAYGDAPAGKSSTRVHAPPGGKSSGPLW